MGPGEFIRRFRKRKGISASEIARFIGVDYWRLQKWENGKGSPRYADAGKINSYFKQELNENVSEEDLEKALNAPFDLEKGLLIGKIASGTSVPAVDEKDRRIRELEDTIKSLQIALEAMKLAIDQQRKMNHHQKLSAMVKKGYENLTEDEKTYLNSVN